MHDATMQKLTATDPETHSTELVAENLAVLKELFPELITEGADGVAVNIDVLKALVGDKTVSDADEKYGLNWHGKRRARQLALTPSTGTLRPCPEDSVDWDTTQNLMIEGDNLEVLKLLQKSYAGKVKLIYIDPPYNTGKDFVYPDNFQDSIKNYLELTGQTEGGLKITTNTDASGRFHTDWLSMLYPRVKLARSLLRDDGAIFVSIDDGEISNLLGIMNEIFGEENHIATFAWQKKDTPSNDSKTISTTHEYVVAYSKSEAFARMLLPRTEAQLANYQNPDNDPRGPWIRSTLIRKEERPERRFEITNPRGDTKTPPHGTSWRIPPETYTRLVEEGRIWWGKDSDGDLPFQKRFLSEVQEGVVPVTWWPYQFAGSNRNAKMEIRHVFGGSVPFDTPKPTLLISRILEIVSSPTDNDIVLDFFAGSGTAAHAVMSKNSEDNGNRRFVVIQIPEPVRATGYSNLAMVCSERIRLVGGMIREKHPISPGDIGFRYFRLDSSNIQAWEPVPDKFAETLEASIEHLKTDRTEQDILFELLLKLGLDLCVPIETKKVEGSANQAHSLHSIGGGSLLVCLSKSIPQIEVEPIALALVVWHQELKPAGDTTVVFRDSAFADDVAKSNITAILQQHGLETVRSL